MSAEMIPAASAEMDGLAFTPLGGLADLPALYAVHEGRIAAGEVDLFSDCEDLPTLEELRAAVERDLAAGQQQRWRLAWAGGQLTGYGKVFWWPEDDGRWVYLVLGWVLPAWRGRGIGTALLRWGEERARQLAAAEHPGQRFEFAANASSSEPQATALLLHEGYTAGYTVLEMDLDLALPQEAPPLPPGIEVRPARPQDLLAIAGCVAEAYRQEYEDNRFKETFDPAEFAARLAGPRHDPALWQVAWDAAGVAGQVLCLAEGGRGEVFEVSVRPDWRRRGLGRALLVRALQVLKERRLQVIRLNTVAQFRTRARDLYSSVGFRVLKEFPRYRKPAGNP